MLSIEHVFVLMLENRSFDHMLGFSGLTGFDAITHAPTRINAPPSGISNSWNGESFPAATPAVDPMRVDPYHEFTDVLEQLSGKAATYSPSGPYPPINNSGFVSNFAEDAKSPSPGDVMQSFAPAQLPVLSALANEFAVCDSWFCSMPGPTWPNRFFALGASSADLDHSPTTAETLSWETIDGFKFQNGSIFEAARGFFLWKRKLKWRIYAGNKIFTLAHALKGIHIWDISRYSKFAKDVSDPNYPAQFTWIEPDDLAGSARVGHVFAREVERGKPTVQLGRVMRLLEELGIELKADVPSDVMQEVARLQAAGVKPLRPRRDTKRQPSATRG